MGESSVRRALWRLFRISSSVLRARELEDVLMAFEVGSRWIGRRVKVVGSSIFCESGLVFYLQLYERCSDCPLCWPR